MPAKIYYIRKNATAKLPTNILFIDCETKSEPLGDAELHTMYIAWSWRVTIDPSGRIKREAWKVWENSRKLCAYVASESRSRSPLYVIGSNITFDIFATGLIEFLTETDWTLNSLYDKGLVTILIASQGDRKLKICAAQNWLQGGVKDWGELLGLEKKEVDFEHDTEETISEYCRRDVEITGRAFLSYLEFVRQHNMGGFALTAAGQSYRCFRHRFMKSKSILHYDQYTYNAFTRAAYYGGRVECGIIGSKEGSFAKLDINSMYPAIMQRHKYPGKIRQWIRDISVSELERKIQGCCGIAEVEISTDEPAYPLHREGKLIFPTGEFIAYLCTESISRALEKGHITKVRQLMTFDAVVMFEDFVNYFYPLKQQYSKEHNGVWTKTVKLVLNSLYGKFGEKRSREIARDQTPGAPVSRIPGLYSREGLHDELPAFDWRYDRHSNQDEEYVRGVEYSLLNTTITEVGEDEGPGSAPQIAAHVTDYARNLLYRYMRLLPEGAVIYCDTDSLIIEEKHLSYLSEVIDNETLGCLKIEGCASAVEIRGAKDYTFGGDLRRKGIRANAKRVCGKCREPISESAKRCLQCGDHVQAAAFTQASFPGFYSILGRGLLGGFPVSTVTKVLTSVYDKGAVGSDGSVKPLKL